MASIVDGFVIPIKKKNLRVYKKLAAAGKKAWMRHGAVSYTECIGDKIDQKWGVPFTKLCKLKSDETVIFAFIVYKSKAHRNKVNKAVEKDPAIQALADVKMPFDMKRFSSGIFKVIVSS